MKNKYLAAFSDPKKRRGKVRWSSFIGPTEWYECVDMEIANGALRVTHLDGSESFIPLHLITGPIAFVPEGKEENE